MAQKRKDILWKSVVDEFVEDMLRFFYPNAGELFDFSKPIEFLDPELAQLFPDRENMKDSSVLDRLIKIARPDGGIACIYLLLEVHDYNNKKVNYDERIFRCFARLYDKYGDGIMALVVYTGSDKSFTPGFFEYSLNNIKLSFRYDVYRVLDRREEELERSTNLFAVFIRTVLLSMKRGKIGNDVLLDLHVQLGIEVSQLGISQDKINELLKFIKLYIDFGKRETNRTLEVRIDAITVKTETMNLYEAEVIIKTEEALEGAKAGIVKNMLQNDKHSFTLQEVAEMAEVTVDFVLEVKKRLESQ